MVSTNLKHISGNASQIGSFPQVEVKIKKMFELPPSQEYPWTGISPRILLSGWDWNPQSYPGEGIGFLVFDNCEGCYKKGVKG